jgi:hypothetical protein
VDRPHEFEEFRRLRSAPPAAEIDGLELAESHGRLDPVEADGNEFVLALRARGFVAHPGRVVAVRRPGDDGGFGRVQLALDVLGEVCAADDLAIPPDGEPFCLERRREFLDPAAIGASVRDIKTSAKLRSPRPFRRWSAS